MHRVQKSSWRSAEKRFSNGHSQYTQTAFASPPRNGNTHASDSFNAPKPSSRHGHNSSSVGYSQRQSIDDKALPTPSERVIGPTLPNMRCSEEYRRPRSPEHGPPPPSSTTKPVPLPDVSIAPPPPSATTKPIPLPNSVAPLPPSATTKPIPLPSFTNVPPVPSGQIRAEPLTHRASHLSVSQTIVEDSPLSAASMLVNPPTPHSNHEMTIPTESTVSSVLPRSSSREPSPGVSSVAVRETETFKLVRTKSGNVQTINDIISAAGEQWEVVEEVNHTRKSSRSRDKDTSGRDHADTREKDRDARRETQRQEKKATEVGSEGSDRRGKRSSKTQRQHSVDDVQKTYSDKAVERSSSMESRSPNSAPARSQDETRPGRTREGQRSGRKFSGSHSASPTKPSSSSSARPLERVPSKSARPTSEVPSAADLNALRAREAWEMERLYKGRSMYGMEANGEAVAPPVMPVSFVPTSNGSIFPSTNKTNGATHGSSHTSFMVQNYANQGSATHIYHSMPTQPPPIVYATMSSPAGHVASSPPRASSSSSAIAASPPRTSPPVSTSSSDLLSYIRPPNPLPEPPRETPTPPLARISQTFLDNNNSPKIERPAEYWTTFAEVSTAH
ncbi:hypothetical protein J3R30DRAFT_1421968 [Lentinula aciculospora]|uniref:Uncharacterized protein n=1 Tax=Lentinula aciculospora TaxID=153920 RepID=A0A9W9ALQ4_9AGAR|nr:hypothetical protein J3R30DRAFT_1421968 [Lentinula aciculospora]